MEILREIERHEIICHTVSYPKGTHNFHWHENYELCRVLRGRCSFRIDGELINAAPGDIIAINGHSVHQFIIEEDNTDITILQFPMKLLLNFGGSVTQICEHIKKDEIELSGISEKCSALFSMLEEEHSATRTEDNRFIEALCASLYLLLSRHFPSNSANATSHLKDRQLFFKITNYINEHSKESISVGALAHEFYFSRDKLSAVFKKYAGISISDYISLIKIKRVNELLLRGVGVTEAAMECGFSGIRTFNNLYKKYMHTTPSEYLRGLNS